MRPIHIYLTAVSLSALAMGVQVVLLPWLVVGELGLGATQVGWVQASVLLPNLLFILVGGVFADRRDGGVWMPLLLLLVMAVHAGLLMLVWSGYFQWQYVLLYGALLGLCQAFMQPLRDTLLARVANPQDGEALQKTVVGLSLGYFLFQGVGHLLAGQISVIGLKGILFLQVLIVGLAALAYRWLAARTTAVSAVTEGEQTSLGSGLRLVWQHPQLRHIIGLIAFNGFVHMGAFIVVMPLLVRDIYGGDAVYFALLQLAFVGGGMLANLMLLRRGMVEYPGRSMLFSLFYAGLILWALSVQPTPLGLVLLVLCWGAVAGTSASMSKAMVQQLAPAGYRGRIMSVYQLALFGMAPLGALACGYGVDHWGSLAVLQVSALVTVSLFTINLLIPGLWALRQSSAMSAITAQDAPERQE